MLIFSTSDWYLFLFSVLSFPLYMQLPGGQGIWEDAGCVWCRRSMCHSQARDSLPILIPSAKTKNNPDNRYVSYRKKCLHALKNQKYHQQHHAAQQMINGHSGTHIATRSCDRCHNCYGFAWCRTTRTSALHRKAAAIAYLFEFPSSVQYIIFF